MIIVMSSGATEEQLQAVEKRIVDLGYEPHLIRGVQRTVVGVACMETSIFWPRPPSSRCRIAVSADRTA